MHIKGAPYIKGTLNVHRVVRKKSAQRIIFLQFYYLSSDEAKFFTQFIEAPTTLLFADTRHLTRAPINAQIVSPIITREGGMDGWNAQFGSYHTF